jgi:LytS/YehU family sensor histidine kinase
MIKDYVDLEKVRYGETFNMTLRIQGDASNKMICPLLLIPFLENSFKHGASQMLTHPWVNLHIDIKDSNLYFVLSNSKPTVTAENTGIKGLGLRNVKKRLAILYPELHSLDISEDSMKFSVSLNVPLFESDNYHQPPIINQQAYELV